MAKRTAWHVRLGPLEWPRYTYARPEGDALKLIGSVRRGPQVGALGMNGEQQYLQVVGDHMTLLNSSQIARAIIKAKAVEQPTLNRTARHAPTAPVVIVKKRRTFSLA